MIFAMLGNKNVWISEKLEEDEHNGLSLVFFFYNFRFCIMSLSLFFCLYIDVLASINILFVTFHRLSLSSTNNKERGKEK